MPTTSVVWVKRTVQKNSSSPPRSELYSSCRSECSLSNNNNSGEDFVMDPHLIPREELIFSILVYFTMISVSFFIEMLHLVSCIMTCITGDVGALSAEDLSLHFSLLRLLLVAFHISKDQRTWPSQKSTSLYTEVKT